MPRVSAKDRPAFVEERRTAILDAALRVWAKRGFDGTSVAEVAREAGLTKGTLYLYFPSKRSLLEEALRRYSLRPDVEAGLARLRGQPLGDVVRGLVALTWRGLTARRELVGVLLRELPNHPEEARRFLEQVVLPLNRLLADYLREVLPAGRARAPRPDRRGSQPARHGAHLLRLPGGARRRRAAPDPRGADPRDDQRAVPARRGGPARRVIRSAAP